MTESRWIENKILKLENDKIIISWSESREKQLIFYLIFTPQVTM